MIRVVGLRKKCFTFRPLICMLVLFSVWRSVQVHPVIIACYRVPTHSVPYLLSDHTLLLSLLLRCDPSEINISDEMSKTTVWKSLSSNQSDSRPVAAKKARPHLSQSLPSLPLCFPHAVPASDGKLMGTKLCCLNFAFLCFTVQD